MGSLSRGTICQFCLRREAHGYIPDPYCAPICDTCDERGNTIGDDAIGEQRVDILATMWLTTRTPRHGDGLPAIFADALIWRIISTFMWDSLVIPSHTIEAILGNLPTQEQPYHRIENLYPTPTDYTYPRVTQPPAVLGTIRALLETLRRHRRNGRDIQLSLSGRVGSREADEMESTDP